MVKSKRITFLASLTKGYDTVLDIGTDHGLVLLEAFQKGYIKQAIAADLREKPLLQAKKNIKNYPCTFVQSDGFLAVGMHFDIAIIAGMGAYLIGDIMEHAPSDDRTYILQANDKQEILRQTLMDLGFMIVDEHLVKDKFYYVIIVCKRGKMDLTKEDLYLGPVLKTKPEATLYYQKKAKQLEDIMLKANEQRKQEVMEAFKIYKDFFI